MNRYGPRINWAEVILELRRASLTHDQIGRQCGADKAWVHRMLNIPGTEPYYTRGVQLLTLWMERTGRGATDVPRC